MTPYETGSTERLIVALDKASADSGRMARRIVWLTMCLVIVGAAQAVATAWPYLVWWWNRRP
jgi:hypothetical protein